MSSHPPDVDASEIEAVLSSALYGRDEDGRNHAVRLTVAVFLAQGHLLLEDVPGVGKTTLARALATAVGGRVGRIQFTPDLMPADLTGVTIYRPEAGSFEFHPGPLFATIVIGDEINRASPKTQSALLEAMQERQVTVDGTSHALPDPFMVIATQNPLEMEGTYALPEAQRDRFMARTSVGYPDTASELALLASGGWEEAGHAELFTMEQARDLMAWVRAVHVSEEVRRYALRLIQATRSHPDVSLGASPRAGLQLLALCRSWAALDQRDHVLPDDVQDLLEPVLGHRLLLTRTARTRGAGPAELLAEVRAETPVT